MCGREPVVVCRRMTTTESSHSYAVALPRLAVRRMMSASFVFCEMPRASRSWLLEPCLRMTLRMMGMG